MIVLQFVKGSDFGADAIAWFGHGADFSHVDTVLPDGKLLGARSDVVGAAPAGVQIRDPGYVGKCRTFRVSLPCSDEMSSAYHGFLWAQIGKPYDHTAIMAFVAGRNWQDPDAWFCSELKAGAMLSAGFFPYPLAAPANKISPPDLLLLISTRVPVILPPTLPKPPLQAPERNPG